MALNPGTNQYSGPACGAKKCFIEAGEAGDITTTVNKGRRAGPMSSLLLLDVYGRDASLKFKIELKIATYTKDKPTWC